MKTFIITKGQYDDYRIEFMLDAPDDADFIGLLLQFFSTYDLLLPSEMYHKLSGVDARVKDHPHSDESSIVDFGKAVERWREEGLVGEQWTGGAFASWQDAFQEWLIQYHGFKITNTQEIWLGAV